MCSVKIVNLLGLLDQVQCRLSYSYVSVVVGCLVAIVVAFGLYQPDVDPDSGSIADTVEDVGYSLDVTGNIVGPDRILAAEGASFDCADLLI